MTMTCKGLAKLIEECGELQQVAGKRLAAFSTPHHWDGTNLNARMIEEMGDVIGAARFVADRFGLSLAEIEARATDKLALFRKWDSDPTNNTHGVDAATQGAQR